MQHETIQIHCDDGVVLSGELLIPEAPRAVIQFNAGTAAKRGVYMKLTNYLCEWGFICCIWDYRGSGESRNGSLKNSNITYSDYGCHDMPAVKAYLDKRFPTLPFFIVAHSAGGQQVGFMPNWQGIRGVVNLGVSAARFKYMPLAFRLQSYLFFYAIVPISVRLKGYVASSSLNLMEDLPARVAREWGDWLTVDDYFFDQQYFGKTVPRGAFKAFDFPILNFHASDDAISTPKNITNFWRHIESTKPITFKRLDPSTHGLKKIDHFGYFKSALKDSLWADIATQIDTWLDEPET